MSNLNRPVFCRGSRVLVEKCDCYRCLVVKKPHQDIGQVVSKFYSRKLGGSTRPA